MRTFKECQNVNDKESTQCSNSVSTVSYSIDDHSLSNYIKLPASVGLLGVSFAWLETDTPVSETAIQIELNQVNDFKMRQLC